MMLLEAALAYAKKGLPVFPCKLDKSPLTPNGFKNATQDANQIREWWTQWPDASIGVRMGTASGWLAIDVDPKNGGDKAFQILLEENGGIPETLHSWTGGGGDHYFFQVRGTSFQSSVGILTRGVDVRAEDSYVIFPPSRHPSGKLYAWASLEKTKISDLPAWLEKKLLERRNGNAPPQGFPDKIPTGMRDNWLTSQAGSYARRGDSVEIIFEKLKIDYAQRCEQEPVKTENDFKRIAKSVWTKEQRRRAKEPQPPTSPPKADIPRAEPTREDDAPGRLPITHIANAERLVEQYGEEIRWCEDREVWCAWRGKYWCVNDEVGLSRRMQKVARGIYREAADSPDKDLREPLWKWAKQSESHSGQSGSIDEARAFVAVRFSEAFDTHPCFLNSRNGTQELDTGEFREHRRQDFLTKIIDIDYRPAATCPKFSKFLAESFGGSLPLINYITRLAGYFLSGLTVEQKWWLFYGATASGKSTFVRILHGLLGPYSLALPENYFLLTKHSNRDFATGNLQGVRLATCVETNEGRRLDVAKIKNMTGEDKISAELKFQNYFEFQPQAKLVLVTNFRPRTEAGDDALWRRLKVVPFHVTVPEEKRIAGLSDLLLREEASGILNWAISGYRAWKENGLQEPPEVTAAVKDYRANEDILEQFLNQCCVRGRDARVLRKVLFDKYKQWSDEEGFQIMSKKKFAVELTRFDIRPALDDRSWEGVRLQETLFD
jgi:putative DNA primase/helicase